MLVSMRRVDIVAPRSGVLRALRAVHRAGLLHLVPYEPPPGVGPAAFGREPAAAECVYGPALERVVELAALLAPAAPPGELVRELWELDDVALAGRAESLGPAAVEAARLTGDRVRLAGEIARLDGYRRIVEGLAGVVGRLPSVRGYGSTGIVVGARYRSIIGAIRDELESLTGGRCEVVAADLGPDRVAAILLYPTRQAAEVASLLGGRDLEEVSLPENLVGVPFEELGPRLALEQERARTALAGVDDALSRLGAAHGPARAALRRVLGDRIAEARALADAGTSDHLVVLGGWVPARRVPELRAALERDAGPDVLVLERSPGEPDAAEAPVAMENGPFLRAFEPLASFVAVPRYGTLDPTPLLGITFPAFVGLMVGDAGYGLALLALLALARRRWRAVPAMAVLWPIGLATAVATIVFGALFGEWFGETGAHLLGLRPLWLDRTDDVIALLALAIAIGVAQVGLGLVLGMVNAALLRHRRELAGRAALLISLAAVLVLLGTTARLLPSAVAPVAAGALVLAAALLVVTVGVAGPIEMLGMLGNVLSYARLMAIGLASVMLAVVADRLGGLLPNVLAGALVAGVLHGLNLLLGFFDSSVQGLRLHYVEFFSKFVEPGGIRYAPFTAVLGGVTGAVARASGGT